MTEVYLALGSNVGDSPAYIRSAVTMLGQRLAAIKTAPLYASKAVGYTDQADFINTAVSARTDMPAAELLDFVKQIEQKVGRTASFRWGPREIDIDIIFYGDTAVDTPRLTIPHPEYHRRDFVLRPLLDLNPDLSDPVSGKPLRALLQKADFNQLKILG